METVRDNKKGLITVIIPVYNCEKYIGRCLESVLKNTYRNLQVICVNDGCTDGSMKVIQMFKSDSRLLILNQENQGVSAARNCGLRFAEGEWIAFVDADDWINKWFFESLISLSEENEADIVLGNLKRVNMIQDEDIEEKPSSLRIREIVKMTAEEAADESVAKHFVTGRIYKREKIKDYFFPKEIKRGEDAVFNIQLYSNETLTIIKTPVSLYYYNIANETSSTHLIDKDDFLKRGIYYLERFKDSEHNNLFLIEGIKSLLAHRYLHMYDTKAVKCQDELLFCEKELKNANLNYRRKIIYYLLIRFPFLYRAYRIHYDKSLIEWEMKERKRNRT